MPVKTGGKGSVSDTEDIARGRSESITESTADGNETDADTAQTIVSTATTPITPTVKSDPLPNTNFPHLFQYSILNVESPGPSDGVGGGVFGSPVFPAPCTPSSVDSGISIRTHNTLLSPNEAKFKKLPLSTFSTTLPPLPPEESAPPLPPQEVEAPPPLPPHPPAVGEEEAEPAGGIENISSDEEKPESPVCATTSPSRNHLVNSDHTFDPSLGLKTLLTTMGEGAKSSNVPYAASASPRPAYELEVEEISGDESPVMVYFEPLKVESISDDENNEGVAGGVSTGGGDDMEIDSDNENEQNNLIEVNVETARYFPTVEPMMGPHPHHMPPHPPFHHPNFYPHPLPPPHPGAFPPMHPHFMMFPPSHSPPPQHGGRRRGSPRRHYDSPPGPFIKDHQVPRPPNGYIGSVSRFPPSRSFSKSKVLRNFSSPKNRTEIISQDVLFKAMEQLRLILLNDVHKKIVESSAYPVLDSHWEKRENEVGGGGGRGGREGKEVTMLCFSW